MLQLPPIGLAATETAQVNIVNTGLPPAGGGLAPFCNGTVVFYNAGGGVLGTLQTFQLQSWQMFSAPFPFASANASGPRTVIRAIVYLAPLKVPTAAGPVVPTCQISSSLETYDTSTGVTHAMVTGWAALSPPPAAEDKSATAR